MIKTGYPIFYENIDVDNTQKGMSEIMKNIGRIIDELPKPVPPRENKNRAALEELIEFLKRKKKVDENISNNYQTKFILGKNDNILNNVYNDLLGPKDKQIFQFLFLNKNIFDDEIYHNTLPKEKGLPSLTDGRFFKVNQIDLPILKIYKSCVEKRDLMPNNCISNSIKGARVFVKSKNEKNIFYYYTWYKISKESEYSLPVFWNKFNNMQFYLTNVFNDGSCGYDTLCYSLFLERQFFIPDIEFNLDVFKTAYKNLKTDIKNYLSSESPSKIPNYTKRFKDGLLKRLGDNQCVAPFAKKTYILYNIVALMYKINIIEFDFGSGSMFVKTFPVDNIKSEESFDPKFDLDQKLMDEKNIISGGSRGFKNDRYIWLDRPTVFLLQNKNNDFDVLGIYTKLNDEQKGYPRSYFDRFDILHKSIIETIFIKDNDKIKLYDNRNNNKDKSRNIKFKYFNDETKPDITEYENLLNIFN